MYKKISKLTKQLLSCPRRREWIFEELEEKEFVQSTLNGKEVILLTPRKLEALIEGCYIPKGKTVEIIRSKDVH